MVAAPATAPLRRNTETYRTTMSSTSSAQRKRRDAAAGNHHGTHGERPEIARLRERVKELARPAPPEPRTAKDSRSSRASSSSAPTATSPRRNLSHLALWREEVIAARLIVMGYAIERL